MQALSAAQLLAVWERGVGLPPAQCAVLLLAAAGPAASVEEVARLPVGRRDAGLLALREQLFGPRLVGRATCPACGAPLELAFNVADIRAAAPPECVEPLTIQADGYEIAFRLPTGQDLIALAGGIGDRTPRAWLLTRCLVAVRHNGTAAAVPELPAAVVEVITARMAEADPQADVQLDLTCPECAGHWQAPFDIATYLWREIDDWAGRLLREVHVLARAYGWAEADILALSPRRRRIYLEMVGG